MKLKNTTDFPDWFLRRMIGWICRHKMVGYKVGDINEAEFRKQRSDAYGSCRGRAFWYSREIQVYIRSLVKFYRGGESVSEEAQSKRIRSLVIVTAHEIEHLAQPKNVIEGKNCESSAEFVAKQVQETFVEQEEELVAKWMAEPAYASKPKKPKPSLVERRYEKAKKDLARWERKLKLAKTKRKKYADKVKYYEKKLGE